MSKMQEVKDEFTAVQNPAEVHALASKTEEMKWNSLGDHQSCETSLTMTSDELSPQVTQNNVPKTVEGQ